MADHRVLDIIIQATLLVCNLAWGLPLCYVTLFAGWGSEVIPKKIFMTAFISRESL